jgi:BlaI family transcriptional regulator, penicillinase repressor
MPARKVQSVESGLSRRERQIMDVLYALGTAAGQDIQARLPGAPSYSTVRTILRVLERKGFVTHTEQNLRYVYKPTVARDTARRSALEHMVRTFFEGSAKQAVAAFLDPRTTRLSKSDLEELSGMIRKAKKEMS